MGLMRGKGDRQLVVRGPTSWLLSEGAGWYVLLSWVGGRLGLVTVGDKWACVGDGCWQGLATSGTVLALVLAIVGPLVTSGPTLEIGVDRGWQPMGRCWYWCWR